jgi:hypothetical protein
MGMVSNYQEPFSRIISRLNAAHVQGAECQKDF